MTLRWTFFALRKTNHGSYLQNRLCLPIYTANLTMVVFRASMKSCELERCVPHTTGEHTKIPDWLLKTIK